MTEKKKPHRKNPDAGLLRKQAEKIARKMPVNVETLSPAEASKLIYELSVHQIELQMQNDELRAAEQRLEEAREQYFSLYEMAPVGYFSISEKGIILEANLTGANMLGVLPRDLRALRFSSLIFEADLDIYYYHRKQLFSTQEPQVFEARIVRKDGSLIWARVETTLTLDGKSGEPVYRAIMSDVTAKKQTDALLRGTEEQYRLLSEHVTDTVWLMDMDLNVTYHSPSVQKLRGFTAEEITEMPLDRHVTPESFKLVSEVLSKELPRVQTDPDYNPVITLELEYCCKDGSTVWTEGKFSVIRDEQGRPISIVGEARDITERKKTHEALKDSEEKYRMVVENALESIYVAVDGMLKFGNNRAESIIGYSIEELSSRPFTEFIHPDDRRMVTERHIQRLQGLDVPNIYTFRIIDKVGGTKWVELSAALINWEGRPATLNFLTDVTDRKRLEEERQRVSKLEAVGVLAGGIAHDFNNILTAILGNISLASTEATPGSELQTSLEQAEKASLRAKALTVKLLTFSKGGAPVKRLASLTEMLNDTAVFALSGTNVKCHFSVPVDLWHAEIDEGQVSQVIHNLVINAQQAMPAGGTIELAAENMPLNETQSMGRALPLKAGNYVRISVADHGIGIPADHLDKIFDPFFSTKQEGSGLGLATSFSIARQHGGHLSVESELGVGSTFYLYLPASTQESLPEQDAQKATKASGKARILVMDDEKGVREVAGRMLRHIGYEDVEFAKDGAEAIKLYKAARESGRPFSAAILDLTVPGGMGGEAAIQKLLKIDPGVKAIVSSGYIDDPVMARYGEYGFSGVVAKPYTIPELRKAVRDVIGAA